MFIPIAESDALMQGAHVAMRAWSRASTEYAEHRMGPWVAVWTLGIAAGLVLLEWLVSHRSPH
jgi:hypothetical protein